jgi:hypothetical protein
MTTPRDPLGALEAWAAGHKSRAAVIDIDTGYGASCWCVTLRGNAREVEASEAGLMKEGCLDDWPGLGATILAALRRAEESGL